MCIRDRADGSSYQCFQIDEVTGQPVRGWQGQGYDDASCWARGQAWLIYGLALCYRYTKDLDFLYAAKCASNYFLNRLPSDLVCNWDLIFTQDEEPVSYTHLPVRHSTAELFGAEPLFAACVFSAPHHFRTDDHADAEYEGAQDHTDHHLCAAFHFHCRCGWYAEYISLAALRYCKYHRDGAGDVYKRQP